MRTAVKESARHIGLQNWLQCGSCVSLTARSQGCEVPNPWEPT